jgi:hypothetical protein
VLSVFETMEKADPLQLEPQDQGRGKGRVPGLPGKAAHSAGRPWDTFRGHVVFRFLLKAQGHEDIRITEEEYGGNCSSGRGEFQGFYVNLPASELAKIGRGVSYTIVPVDQRTDYTWQVKEGVQLIRP